jgi:hypothetical protein
VGLFSTSGFYRDAAVRQLTWTIWFLEVLVVGLTLLQLVWGWKILKMVVETVRGNRGVAVPTLPSARGGARSVSIDREDISYAGLQQVMNSGEVRSAQWNSPGTHSSGGGGFGGGFGRLSMMPGGRSRASSGDTNPLMRPLVSGAW